MVKNKSKGVKLVFIIVFLIFAIYSFTLIFPFGWLFLNSFKMDIEFRANTFSMPIRWIFENYYEAITYSHKGMNILQMFWNSLMTIIVICIPGSFFQACTSYILSKYKFKMNKALFNVALVIMIIPGIGSTAATYSMWHTLGIYDTYFSLFLMGSSGFGSSFLLVYASFKNLSWTYAEAAFMDGASHFKVFIKIMLPQVMPVLVSLGIITVIGTWNDYYTPYMYLPSHTTIAVGLYEIQESALRDQQYPQFFALMILTLLPVMLLFIMMQNTIMENITTGGLKG